MLGLFITRSAVLNYDLPAPVLIGSAYLIVFELRLAQQLSVLVRFLFERRVGSEQPDVGLALLFTGIGRLAFTLAAPLPLPLEQPLVAFVKKSIVTLLPALYLSL